MRICRARVGGRPDAAALRAAARVLRRGGLVVAPTDTVYGLAADPAVSGAEDRLRAAKHRPESKPIPFLAGSLEQVEACGARLGPVERALARRFWPGPLTLVLRVGRREEGFRVPAHPVMLALLKAMGRPLRVTSANRSGAPAPRTLAEAMADLADVVELGLDDGPSPGGVPSTVARARRGQGIRLIRRGALSAAALRGAWIRPRAARRTVGKRRG